MIKIPHIFILLSLLVYSWAQGATCTLDTVPGPPIESYEKNVDTILETAKGLASRASCTRDWTAGGAMSSWATKRALDIVQGTNYDIWNYFRSNAFYLDASDKTLLPSALEHDKYILGIQQKILGATAEIGSKCAGDIVSFPKDVDLGDALYKTKKRTLQEVMNDLYSQSSEVLTFYRDLATNTRNSKYMDETNFTVAPDWFSDDMREFYSAENIQQCHDEDPKKQQIQEEQKKGLVAALKYPQGVSIWKRAFQLLLYGNNVLSQSQEGEDSSIIAHAKKWGLGNSKALLDKLLNREFWFPWNAQSSEERLQEAAKQNAYGGGAQVPTSFSQTSERLKQASGSVTPASSFLDNSSRAKNLAAVVGRQIESGTKNREKVADGKESNYLTTTPLVNAMEAHIASSKTLNDVADKVCEIYEKRQALNIERDSCDQIFADNGWELLDASWKV